MPNFFTQNLDLRRRIRNAPWNAILPALEQGFADPHELAPSSLEEALDFMDATLDLVGEICANEIAPHAAEVDREGAQLVDGEVRYAAATTKQLKLLAESGLMGFILPRAHGGLNLPVTCYTAAVEMVSQADASLMTLFALQGCGETLHRFGDAEVHERYLSRLCAGEITACMALTEPGAGSDLGAVRMRAVPRPGPTPDGVGAKNGSWILNGSKCFITNGGADVLLTLARTEDVEGGAGVSLFAGDRGAGVEVPKLEEKLGIHGSPTAVVNFDDATGYLLGKRGEGLYRCTLGLLHQVRLEVAAQAVGVAQAAQSAAAQYATEREQFGRSIDRFAPVREMLFRNALQIEAARAIVFTTAAVVDRKRGILRSGGGPELERYERMADLLTPLSKFYACEIVNEVTSRAIQVHGGYGYTQEYPVERHMRDGRITNIYEGTSEIQVGGMIDALLDGGLALLFEEPLRDTSEPPSCAGVLDSLRQTYAHLLAAADRARAADTLAVQGWARGIAETTAGVMATLVFLRDASEDDRSATLARFHASETLLRGQLCLRAAETGDRTVFDDESFRAVVEPYRGGA
ncbi:MAG: acyl-CoA dehydrogenase family protein [Planctomycetota bacterium]